MYTSTSISINATAILTTTMTIKHGSKVKSSDIQHFADRYNNEIPRDWKGRRVPFLAWVKKTYGWDFTGNY